MKREWKLQLTGEVALEIEWKFQMVVCDRAWDRTSTGRTSQHTVSAQSWRVWIEPSSQSRDERWCVRAAHRRAAAVEPAIENKEEVCKTEKTNGTSRHQMGSRSST